MFFKLLYKQIWAALKLARAPDIGPYIAFSELIIRVPRLFQRWITLKLTPRRSYNSDADVTAILLSHNRPWNMSIIVDTLTRIRCISKIVVANSNKEFRISDWIKIKDDRISLIDETKKTFPGVRYYYATVNPSRFYLSIDDDYYLSISQIESLINALRASVAIPHGLRGDVVISKDGVEQWHSQWCESSSGTNEVDCLIGVYVFTNEHLRRYIDLAQKLGITDLSTIKNFDDIVLSFCGDSKSLTHDFGNVLDCLSSYADGVALHRGNPSFKDERMEVFHKLKQLTAR